MLPNMIVPVLNRYDLLQKLLDSIDFPIRDLLIIDNGGDLDRVTFPKSVLNSHVLSMPSNLGVAASWNLGVKLFPHDHNWFFASNDAWFGPGDLERLSQARRDALTICDVFPYWQVFSVGDEALTKVGLWDEALYPAFGEDNDWMNRCAHYGVDIVRMELSVRHDNSSTIHSDPDLFHRNSLTFPDNMRYLSDKVERGDFSAGGWSLDRRRRNAWDGPRVE
jgi:glycosyltransferase involved in cell wall biosynthesis